MAIVTPDQGSVDLGRSRISPPDTYVPVRSVGAGGGLDELARSLQNFGVSVGATQQRLAQEQDLQSQSQIEQRIDDLRKDDALGTLTQETYGQKDPGASTATRIRAVSYAGQRYMEENFSPRLTEIVSDPALMADPVQRKIKLDELQNQARDTIGKNNDLTFRSGALEWFTRQRDNLEQNGRLLESREIQAANQTLWEKSDGNNQQVLHYQTVAQKVAEEVGLPPAYLVPFLKMENGSADPNAKNDTSTAGGLFQITKGTWDYLQSKYPQLQGMDRFNGRANALGAALYAKENYENLKGFLKREPSPAEVYAAHLFGPTGARKFLTAASEDGGADPRQYFGTDLVANNPSVFYKNPKERTGLRSVSEVKAYMEKGVNDNNFYRVAVPNYAGAKRMMFQKETFYSKNYAWTDLVNNGASGGDGTVDSRAVNALDAVTDQFGRKLKITSAFRDSEYNQKVASSGPNGPHTHGDALDVSLEGMSEKEKKHVVSLFIANGAEKVGVYNGHLHVDFGGDKPTGKFTTWDKRNGVKSGTGEGDWFQAALDEGKQWREQGTVPARGFNGQPMNPIEARIQAAKNFGILPSRARELIVNNSIASAQASTDYSGSALVLNNMLQYANVTPMEAAKLRQTVDQLSNAELTRATHIRTAQKQAEEDHLEKVLKPQIIKEMEVARQTGEAPNPMKYANNSKAYEYALARMADNLIDPGKSAAATVETLNALNRAAATKDYTPFGFKPGEEPTETELAYRVQKMNNLRTDDKEKIIKEGIGKSFTLLRATEAQVDNYYKEVVKPYVDAYTRSIDGKIDEKFGADTIPVTSSIFRYHMTHEMMNFIKTRDGSTDFPPDLVAKWRGDATQLVKDYLSILEKKQPDQKVMGINNDGSIVGDQLAGPRGPENTPITEPRVVQGKDGTVYRSYINRFGVETMEKVKVAPAGDPPTPAVPLPPEVIGERRLNEQLKGSVPELPTDRPATIINIEPTVIDGVNNWLNSVSNGTRDLVDNLLREGKALTSNRSRAQQDDFERFQQVLEMDPEYRRLKQAADASKGNTQEDHDLRMYELKVIQNAKERNKQ